MENCNFDFPVRGELHFSLLYMLFIDRADVGSVLFFSTTHIIFSQVLFSRFGPVWDPNTTLSLSSDVCRIIHLLGSVDRVNRVSLYKIDGACGWRVWWFVYAL